MLAGAEDIFIDQLSEVYSMAAVLFVLYTHLTVSDYGSGEGSFEQKLNAIISGHKNDPKNSKLPVNAEILHVLNWALQPDRATRCPDMSTFVNALDNVRRSFNI